MATVGRSAESPIGSTSVRQRGVVDRLLSLVDRFPGPAALWFAMLALLLLAVAHLWIWATGARRMGELEPEVVPPTLIFAFFLWLLHLLKHVAGSSFDAFRPALGGSADAQERYRLALTSVPDRVALAAVVIVEVVLNVSYFGTIRPLRLPLPVSVELASAALYLLAAASIALLIVQDLRQLRLVSRLSALAANVDIFKPGPVTALSRLTAASAIGIVAFVAAYGFSTGLTVPTAQESVPFPAFIAEELALILLAVASFVLPLRVMHGRLLNEKNDLLGAAQDRLKVVLARIHEAVETGDLSQADQLNKTLTSVIVERDYLAKLPTWPWSSGTFRGVASAVVLPVVIFVITRVIDPLL